MEDRADVDHEQAVEGFVGRLCDRVEIDGARVIHEDVEPPGEFPAEGSVELRDQLRRTVRMAEIGAGDFCRAAGVPDLRRDRFRRLTAGAVVDEHGGAVPRETAGHGAADRAGCAGDEGDFSSKRLAHLSSWKCALICSLNCW